MAPSRYTAPVQLRRERRTHRATNSVRPHRPVQSRFEETHARRSGGPGLQSRRHGDCIARRRSLRRRSDPRGPTSLAALAAASPLGQASRSVIFASWDSSKQANNAAGPEYTSTYPGCRSICERANVAEQRHSHEYYSTPLSRHSQVVSAVITFSEADKRIHCLTKEFTASAIAAVSA